MNALESKVDELLAVFEAQGSPHWETSTREEKKPENGKEDGIKPGAPNQ